MGKIKNFAAISPEVSQHYVEENKRILAYVTKIKAIPTDEDAFKEIVRVLHSYLQHLALKKFFFVAGHSADDIYQEGLYALATKAIPDYDAQKGPFIGFAKLCIKRHIITVLKSANNGKHRPLNGYVPLDAPAGSEEEGPGSIGGFLPNGDDDLVEILLRYESHSRLRGLLRERLTPLESQVLELYLKSMSYTDIVQFLNKTRRGRNRLKAKVIDNALCRIKKKALEMEQQMGPMDIDE